MPTGKNFENMGCPKIGTLRKRVCCGDLKPDRGSTAESLALKLAQRNHTITVPYASEAGQFQSAHVPTVVCGPGSIDQAHQPDEYIDIAQIKACIAFMRMLAAELR